MSYTARKARKVLEGLPDIDIDRAVRITRREETVPLEWPSNWQFILMILVS